MKNDLLSLIIKEFASDGIISESERMILELKAKEIGITNDELTQLLEEELSHEAEFRKGKEMSHNYYASLSQPTAAIEDIKVYPNSIRKLPDLVRIGTFIHLNESLNMQVPGLIPFYGTNGLKLNYTASDTNAISPEKLIETIVYRLVLSIPNKMVKLHIIDSEHQGNQIRNIISLPEKIRGKEMYFDEDEINITLKELLKKSSQIKTMLGNSYSSLAVYNENNKQNQKPYQFLIVIGFPYGFNKNSSDTLQKLLKNGPVSGLYTIMSFDYSAPVPYDVDVSKFDHILTEIELSVKESNLIRNFYQFKNSEYLIENFKMLFDDTLPEDINEIINHLNSELELKETKIVDIAQLVSSVTWNSSSTKGIRIPIGHTSEGKNQFFELGLGSSVHHALIAGATGSGKTILLHDIIVNGAQLYSPKELKYVLMDYKEGTEFNIYKKLPHIHVLSIASNPEFGLSVLENMEEEIESRGDLFKQHNVNNFEAYKSIKGNILPRFLIIIDEFQVLINTKGIIGSKASIDIEDIAKRGRSFGINMILSTQSLYDVDISTSTLSQIGLRIAMKLLDSDCYRILSHDNNAPANFSKPGQALYNSGNGKKENNIEFQAAYISTDKIQNIIDRLTKEVHEKGINLPKPFLFVGNKDALLENNTDLILQKPKKKNENFDIFIGEPCFLNDKHIYYCIRQQEASNVLVVGDDPSSVISLTLNTIKQIYKQSNKSKYFIASFYDIDEKFNKHIGKSKSLEENIVLCRKHSDLEDIIEQVILELDNRIETNQFDHKILFSILNAGSARNLRKDGYSQSSITQKIIRIFREGPEMGIHMLFHTLSYNVLLDILENKDLYEFENKIALKGNDSIKLIDEYTVEPIRNKYEAIIKSPWCKYAADRIRIYKV